MSSMKKLEDSGIENENPEWTRADFLQARPATELIGNFAGEKAIGELLQRGKGRPPKEDRKVNQTIRLDQDVLDAYRQTGRGWQTHMNEVLRQNMPRRAR